MKNMLIIIVVICWWASVVQAIAAEGENRALWGVKNPVEYLGQLPSVPGSGCEVTHETIEQFKKDYFPAMKELSEDVANRRRIVKKWQEKNSKKMQENVVDMPGFKGKSQDEMKKMSKKQRREMAEQMMEDKFGVSMQELKDQKKAQKAGKTSANVDWAKAMAGEMQANDLMKPKGEVEASKRKITDNIKLAKEQEELIKATIGLRTRMLNSVNELEKDEVGLSLKKKIEDEEKNLQKMITEGASCKKLDAQSQVITDARGLYCSYMAPQYLKSLHNYFSSIETSLSKHLRLDQVMSEMQKNQVGVELSGASIGLSGLETVQDFARYLGEVYKYNNRDPSVTPGSHCDGAEGN